MAWMRGRRVLGLRVFRTLLSPGLFLVENPNAPKENPNAPKGPELMSIHTKNIVLL
jgi:hypothetical protein